MAVCLCVHASVCVYAHAVLVFVRACVCCLRVHGMNQIRHVIVSYTGRYTLLSFLPKNLYEQFRRIANLYSKHTHPHAYKNK